MNYLADKMEQEEGFDRAEKLPKPQQQQQASASRMFG
jgi:hypothetical protein